MSADVIDLDRPRPYPLPLTAGGMRNDLPHEYDAMQAYARCDVQVRAKVVELWAGLHFIIEIIEGNEDLPSLKPGARITVSLDLEADRRLAGYNLIFLVEAAGLSVFTMRDLTEVIGRPFLMSVAVPCE
jgi:hypothetical protein